MNVKKIGVMSDSELLSLIDRAEKVEWRHCFRGDEGDTRRDFWANTTASGRFMKIKPGGYLHPHSDTHGHKTLYVVQSNPDSFLRVGDETVCLDAGSIYDIDFSLEHESWNNGDTDRIHFVSFK